jgi:hypothetical protein
MGFPVIVPQVTESSWSFWGRPCLLLAKRELRLPQLIAKLGRFKALIIDDLGYVQQSREEMEVLFTLLSERYERTSVLVSDHGSQRHQLSFGSSQGKPASPIACQAQRFNILSLQLEEINSGILVVAKVGI